VRSKQSMRVERAIAALVENEYALRRVQWEGLTRKEREIIGSPETFKALRRWLTVRMAQETTE
jgi:Trm5-related predicted tRNA methylase